MKAKSVSFFSCSPVVFMPCRVDRVLQTIILACHGLTFNGLSKLTLWIFIFGFLSMQCDSLNLHYISHSRTSTSLNRKPMLNKGPAFLFCFQFVQYMVTTVLSEHLFRTELALLLTCSLDSNILYWLSFFHRHYCNLFPNVSIWALS